MSVPSRMSKEKLKEYAHRYLDIGWSLTPIRHIKDPQTGDVSKNFPVKWKEYQDRLPTKLEVDNWIEQGYYLAVVTGHLSSVVVVDDDRVKNGLPEYKIISPIISQTATGGKHYYFRYTPGITLSVNHEIHMDIRGQGGNATLPPFGNYKWIKPPTIENLKALSPMSEALQRELMPASFNVVNGIAQPVKLEDLVGLDKGSRNDSLLRLANSLCNRYPRDDWGGPVWQILMGANNSFTPPLSEKEVRIIFDQATRFVATNPKKTTAQRRGEEAERTEPVFYSKMSAEEMKKVEKREKLWLGVDKVDRIFDFPTGYYVICANPGAGKGFFAMWLSRKGFELHGKKSVFFSLEMPELQVRTRLLQAWSDLTLQQFEKGASTAQAEKLMREDSFVVYPFGETDAAYQTPENFEKDVDEFYKKGYRIFHFDHFHELEGATSTDTNPRLAERWSKMFQNLCKTKYKDIWLFVYAQPNGAAARKSLLRRDDISGSKVITQKCEVFISLNREITINKETKEVEVNAENRNITLWLDKNRISNRQYVGAQLYFGEDGNFYDSDYQAKQGRMITPTQNLETDVTEAFGLEDNAFSDF